MFVFMSGGSDRGSLGSSLGTLRASWGHTGGGRQLTADATMWALHLRVVTSPMHRKGIDEIAFFL